MKQCQTAEMNKTDVFTDKLSVPGGPVPVLNVASVAVHIIIN